MPQQTQTQTLLPPPNMRVLTLLSATSPFIRSLVFALVLVLILILARPSESPDQCMGCKDKREWNAAAAEEAVPIPPQQNDGKRAS